MYQQRPLTTAETRSIENSSDANESLLALGFSAVAMVSILAGSGCLSDGEGTEVVELPASLAFDALTYGFAIPFAFGASFA